MNFDEGLTMKTLSRRRWQKTLMIVAILLQLILQPSLLRADITPITDPFTGDFIETWEGFPVGYPGSPATVFGGRATISGDNPFVWMTTFTLGTPGGLGLGPFPARAVDGSHGYVTSVSPGTGRINFQAPVTDFGGYWGYSVGYPAATFGFYDSQGSLIGTQSFTYTAPNFNGTLEWQGWHSTVPISSVEWTGHWVANDSLRIVVVPEPATGCLLVVAGVVLCAGRNYAKTASRRS
jgi:hypothetical protein